MKKRIKERKPSDRGYFLRKRVFSICFFTLLFGYFSYNMANNYEVYLNTVNDAVNKGIQNPMGLPRMIHSVEDTLNTEIVERMKFLEIFSFTQKVLDKREVNNFDMIMDETGSLHYASFYKENDKNCFEYALRVKRLKDYVSQFGTDVLFVVAPSKYVADDDRLRLGMPVNDPQILIDQTMFYMNRMGIETLDLNKYLPNEKVPYEEAFFRTDHHWTIPAAFEATKILADTLNDRFGYELDTETYLADNQFTSVEYKHGMLGSMGRKTGACFSGVDDITIIYPKFNVKCSRTFSDEQGGENHSEGDLIGTLIVTDLLKKDNLYGDSQYSTYMHGVRSFDHVINESNPDGKRFFMIRDSYFSPVITFLTPMVGQVDAVWSLAEERNVNIEEQILNNRYDCIIVEMYPFNIGDDAFQFFRDEKER